jgi:phenolic acid decarboxylase
VVDNPERTICFQNEHISEMLSYRDIGPTYPKLVIDEFAVITFIENCGVDNEEVIQCAAHKLPNGYASRNN